MSHTELTTWNTKLSAWSLWLWWIVATSAPGILALVISDLLVIGQPKSSISFSGDNGLGPLLYWFCGITFIGGALIGAAQALCLDRLTNFKMAARLWVPLTIASIPLAMVVNVAANISFYIGAGALLAGFVIGGVQTIAFRTLGSPAFFWFLGSGIAWIVSFLAGFWITDRFLTRDPVFGLPYYTLQSATYWGAASTIALLLYGALTGLILLMLVRSSLTQDART